MSDDKNNTLKILAGVGAAKAIGDLHDIKKHLERQAEQDRKDRLFSEAEKSQAAFEQKKKEMAAEEERAVAETERARTKKLQESNRNR